MRNSSFIRSFLKIFAAVLLCGFIQSCSGGNNALEKSEAYQQFTKFLDSLAAASGPKGNSLPIGNINGLRQEGFDFFNAEGYNIDLEVMDRPLDENTTREIKRKYEITDRFTKEAVQANYWRYGNEEVKDSVLVSTVFYVIGVSPAKTLVLSYRTAVDRNIPFELGFNRLAIGDSIPGSCFSNMVVDSIRFAGRYIPLGRACNWMGANNIQCPHLGQMNWSEFREMERANQMIQNQLIMSSQDVTIESTELIDILFEKNKTKALRVTYKIGLPKIVLGGSNRIVTYYVVSEVRDRYVGCVLSHYDDDAKKNELPPLLAEVMELSL